MHEREKWKWYHSVVSDSSRPHGLQPTRLLRPRDFPGKSTGVGCHCRLRIPHWKYPKQDTKPNVLGYYMEILDGVQVSTSDSPSPCCVLDESTLLDLHITTFIFGGHIWCLLEKEMQPTPVFLPGESHGWRSLVGYSPQVAKSQTQLSDFTFTSLMLNFTEQQREAGWSGG